MLLRSHHISSQAGSAVRRKTVGFLPANHTSSRSTALDSMSSARNRFMTRATPTKYVLHVFYTLLLAVRHERSNMSAQKPGN
jgi:hypothetical protein